MYRLLKPKNIHRALIGLILLAPIVYLFGSQFTAFAGAHGAFADDEYSVTDSTTYAVHNMSQNSSLVGSISDNPTTVRVLQGFYPSPSFVVGHSYRVNAITYIEGSYSSSVSIRWRYPSIGGSSSFVDGVGNSTLYFVYDGSNDFFALQFYNLSNTDSFSFEVNNISCVDLTLLFPDVEPTQLQQTYMDVFGDYVIPAGDTTYTHNVTKTVGFFDYVFHDMFTNSNFLTVWGEDALSENRHGFAPVGELFKYVDDNMLHLSDKQIGKMAYGYMYYVVHVLIFDIVALAFVFVVTIPQKVLNMINDKTGGDL